MTQSTAPEQNTQVVVIFFHRVLELFPPESIRAVERHAKPPLRYPDGSLQFDFESYSASVALGEDPDFKLLPPWLSIRFTKMRNLSPFPPKEYDLYYGMEYQEMIGEGRFIGVGNVFKMWPGEQHLEDLLFTVIFRRRASEAVRRKFARLFGQWLDSVSDHGLWSEGPLALVRPEAQIRGNRAEVHLDASRTGPHTLMWLILWALEFGYQVAPIEAAQFNADDPAFLQTMLECMKRHYTLAGKQFDAEMEQKWNEQRLGGKGPRFTVPLDVSERGQCASS